MGALLITPSKDRNRRFLLLPNLWIHHFEAALKEYDIHTISPQTAVDYIFRLLSEAPPYSEAKDVITALREAGMRVVVASNADDVHLFPVLERARIEPEFILSSEQVQSYKASQAVLRRRLRPPGYPIRADLVRGRQPQRGCDRCAQRRHADLLGAPL